MDYWDQDPFGWGSVISSFGEEKSDDLVFYDDVPEIVAVLDRTVPQIEPECLRDLFRAAYNELVSGDYQLMPELAANIARYQIKGLPCPNSDVDLGRLVKTFKLPGPHAYMPTSAFNNSLAESELEAIMPKLVWVDPPQADMFRDELARLVDQVKPVDLDPLLDLPQPVEFDPLDMGGFSSDDDDDDENKPQQQHQHDVPLMLLSPEGGGGTKRSRELVIFGNTTDLLEEEEARPPKRARQTTTTIDADEFLHWLSSVSVRAGGGSTDDEYVKKVRVERLDAVHQRGNEILTNLVAVLGDHLEPCSDTLRPAQEALLEMYIREDKPAVLQQRASALLNRIERALKTSDDSYLPFIKAMRSEDANKLLAAAAAAVGGGGFNLPADGTSSTVRDIIDACEMDGVITLLALFGIVGTTTTVTTYRFKNPTYYTHLLTPLPIAIKSQINQLLSQSCLFVAHRFRTDPRQWLLLGSLDDMVALSQSLFALTKRLPSDASSSSVITPTMADELAAGLNYVANVLTGDGMNPRFLPLLQTISDAWWRHSTLANITMMLRTQRGNMFAPEFGQQWDALKAQVEQYRQHVQSSTHYPVGPNEPPADAYMVYTRNLREAFLVQCYKLLGILEPSITDVRWLPLPKTHHRLPFYRTLRIDDITTTQRQQQQQYLKIVHWATLEFPEEVVTPAALFANVLAEARRELAERTRSSSVDMTLVLFNAYLLIADLWRAIIVGHVPHPVAAGGIISTKHLYRLRAQWLNLCVELMRTPSSDHHHHPAVEVLLRQQQVASTTDKVKAAVESVLQRGGGDNNHPPLLLPVYGGSSSNNNSVQWVPYVNEPYTVAALNSVTGLLQRPYVPTQVQSRLDTRSVPAMFVERYTAREQFYYHTIMQLIHLTNTALLLHQSRTAAFVNKYKVPSGAAHSKYLPSTREGLAARFSEVIEQLQMLHPVATAIYDLDTAPKRAFALFGAGVEHLTEPPGWRSPQNMPPPIGGQVFRELTRAIAGFSLSVALYQQRRTVHKKAYDIRLQVVGGDENWTSLDFLLLPGMAHIQVRKQRGGKLQTRGIVEKQYNEYEAMNDDHTDALTTHLVDLWTVYVDHYIPRLLHIDVLEQQQQQHLTATRRLLESVTSSPRGSEINFQELALLRQSLTELKSVALSARGTVLMELARTLGGATDALTHMVTLFTTTWRIAIRVARALVGKQRMEHVEMATIEDALNELALLGFDVYLHDYMKAITDPTSLGRAERDASELELSVVGTGRILTAETMLDIFDSYKTLPTMGNLTPALLQQRATHYRKVGGLMAIQSALINSVLLFNRIFGTEASPQGNVRHLPTPYLLAALTEAYTRDMWHYKQWLPYRLKTTASSSLPLSQATPFQVLSIRRVPGQEQPANLIDLLDYAAAADDRFMFVQSSQMVRVKASDLVEHDRITHLYSLRNRPPDSPYYVIGHTGLGQLMHLYTAGMQLSNQFRMIVETTSRLAGPLYEDSNAIQQTPIILSTILNGPATTDNRSMSAILTTLLTIAGTV